MSKLSISLTLLLFLAAASAARGDEDSGISVFGSGEVRAKPTRVEIDLTAGAGAELTGDALVKYQDALRRTLSAFEKLELKNLLTIRPRPARRGWPGSRESSWARSNRSKRRPTP